MTSTEFTIGLEGSRNSSKVLKPPGGGSSISFGSQSNSAVEKEPVKVSTTKSRLFGEGEATPIKNYVRRNPILGNINEVMFEGSKSCNKKENPKERDIARNPITGTGVESNDIFFESQLSCKERKVAIKCEAKRNPITGEGVENSDLFFKTPSFLREKRDSKEM